MTLTSAELLLQKAVNIATTAHEGQTRWDKRTPYITHPLAVMAQLDRPYEKIAAVLHDVLEDTNVRAVDLLQAGIPEEVVTALLCLTHAEGTSYALYIRKLSKNSLARAVKTADILHNLSDLDRKKDRQRFDKYLLALQFLNPVTLDAIPAENLQDYVGKKVFSLNTGVRGSVTDVYFDGKEGPQDPDVKVHWVNGESSIPFHSWCQAIALIGVI